MSFKYLNRSIQDIRFCNWISRHDTFFIDILLLKSNFMIFSMRVRWCFGIHSLIIFTKYITVLTLDNSKSLLNISTISSKWHLMTKHKMITVVTDYSTTRIGLPEFSITVWWDTSVLFFVVTNQRDHRPFSLQLRYPEPGQGIDGC